MLDVQCSTFNLFTVPARRKLRRLFLGWVHVDGGAVHSWTKYRRMICMSWQEEKHVRIVRLEDVMTVGSPYLRSRETAATEKAANFEPWTSEPLNISCIEKGNTMVCCLLLPPILNYQLLNHQPQPLLALPQLEHDDPWLKSMLELILNPYPIKSIDTGLAFSSNSLSNTNLKPFTS